MYGEKRIVSVENRGVSRQARAVLPGNSVSLEKRCFRPELPILCENTVSVQKHQGFL